ncbi:pseudoazurin [Stappia sp. ICDLI1TA098]
MNRIRIFTLVLATGLVAMMGVAQAAEHEVKMLNKGATGVMVFEPDLLQIAPGDTVRFVSTNPGHNAETIKGMIPQGAEPFAGKMSKDVTVTFDTPGVYGIKCKPHFAMGMVAAVVVGEPVNLAEVKAVKNPGRAGKKFETLLGGL